LKPAAAAQVAISEEPEPAGERARRAPPQVARDLIERIVSTGGADGVTALLADAGVGSSPLYALITARALSREGRAILVQAGPDRRLDAAMAEGSDHEQPGLAQLLAGEASYAEAIYRDGETRLHLLGRGGALDADAEDLRMVIDVLRATYDFVLLAVASDSLGLELAREADVVVALGPKSTRRDYLLDDFTAAGARDLVLACPDFDGQLTEGAA
jgi:MinD-like ATPase involved in chromosome partitioning or flagellar assembly